MAFITMWQRDGRVCMFVVDGERLLVRLIDGICVICEELVQSAESALRLAERWEIEERRAVWPLPPRLAGRDQRVSTTDVSRCRGEIFQ